MIGQSHKGIISGIQHGSRPFRIHQLSRAEDCTYRADSRDRASWKTIAKHVKHCQAHWTPVLIKPLGKYQTSALTSIYWWLPDSRILWYAVQFQYAPWNLNATSPSFNRPSGSELLPHDTTEQQTDMCSSLAQGTVLRCRPNRSRIQLPGGANLHLSGSLLEGWQCFQK